MIKKNDYVKVSEVGKNLLLVIKKNTEITQWNVLLRIALAISLKMDTPIVNMDIGKESNVAVEWKTFCGESEKIFKYLLLQAYESFRRKSSEFLSYDKFVRLHIERGIKELAKEKKLNTIVKSIQSISIGRY